MKKKNNINAYRSELMENILTDIDRDMDDTEIVNLLSEKKVSENDNEAANDSIGSRFADTIANFVGSWTFILLFIGVLLSWMLLNALFLSNKGFDPYPFILLNLVLSCVAAIQAPLIMMSQNRQEAKDRLRSENAYKVNLKSEIVMAQILTQLEIMAAKQDSFNERLKAIEVKLDITPYNPSEDDD